MSVLERFAQIQALVQITIKRFGNPRLVLHLLTEDLPRDRISGVDTGFNIGAYEIDYAIPASRLCFPGNGAIEALLVQASAQHF